MEKLLEKQTLMMSTIGKDGMPKISYAPFVKRENAFYIYISKTAEHHANLVNHGKAAIMLIEDETGTKMQFARCRVSFNCEAYKLEEDNGVWPLFEERFGAKMMNTLQELDFDLFEVKVIDGRLVKGFGQAFDITVEADKMVLNQVFGMGHKK